MKITVFTPTYNRAYILGQAYESLKNQTNKDFIWLIIDDGSTDNTEELVNNWKIENQINIKYIKQENSGKHIAHNTAVKNCDTEFLLILDSDDYLSENAIEILEKEAEKISDMPNISGIIGNRYNAKTKQVIGTKMPDKIQYASAIELYEKYKFKGDTLRLYKTSILKEFLFPEIENEKFIYENVIFDQIDNRYKMLIDRHELYYGEYLEDGYTSNELKIKINNPTGYLLSLNSSIKYSIKMSNKVKWTILYIIWEKILKKKGYSIFYNKILYIIMYPIAYIFYKCKKPSKIFKNLEVYKKTATQGGTNGE